MTAQQALRKIPQPFRDLVKDDIKKHSPLQKESEFKNIHQFINSSFLWSLSEIGREFYEALAYDAYHTVYGEELYKQII